MQTRLWMLMGVLASALVLAGCQTSGKNKDVETTLESAAEDAKKAELSPEEAKALEPIESFTPPKVGTKTSLRTKSPKGTTRANLTITSHEDTFNDRKVWTWSGKDRIGYYDFKNNRQGGKRVDGTKVSRYVKQREYYRFPMKPGDAWTTTYEELIEDDNERFSGIVDVTVKGWETIKVPAGTYRAMHIEQKATAGSRFTRNVWFVPELGIEAKIEIETSAGKTVVELMRYRAGE